MMTASVPLTPLEPWIAAKIGDDGRPLDPEHLRSHQLAKLNETLAWVAEQSAFYRRSLGGTGVRLSALEDIADLPFTTAEDLRTAPFNFLCVRQGEVERIVTLPTSGTTGAPKRIFFTAEDQELTRDFFRWGMSTLVGAGDRVLILLPGSLPGSVGDLLKTALERMGVEAIAHGPVTDPERTLDVMREEDVTVLVGIPVQVLSLIRGVDAGRRQDGIKVKSVLLSTDRLPKAVSRTIEQAWGCRVYDHYGTTEMGLGGGVDCRARNGYHLREADLLFEVVDPATGRPVPDGVSGEVVFTTLTRRATPLVRYRTGDVSRFIPEPCPCGTVLRRMAHVDHRLDGDIVLPGGGILRQRDLDEALLALDRLADFRARIVQTKGRVTLVVHIRPNRLLKYDTPPPEHDQHAREKDRGSANSSAIRATDDVLSCCSARSGSRGFVFQQSPSVGAFPVHEDEIVRVLHSIPALSSQVARDLVSIEVRGWDDAEVASSGTTKRKVEHMVEANT
jgi:phenylacetate-CoA ligase